MTEDEHDKHVAPLLLEACKKAEALGGTVLCYSEYGDKQEDGYRDVCRTMVMKDATPAARLVEAALKSKGNLDLMIMGLMKAHREGALDLSRTVVAYLLMPSERTEP